MYWLNQQETEEGRKGGNFKSSVLIIDVLGKSLAFIVKFIA
jgi:hypothetical protein